MPIANLWNYYFRIMLSRLEISNYAIIESLQITFHPGFNIITGETGAGKSILMGALGLVLGDRADTAVLFNRQEKCFVEALFVPANTGALHHLLESNDLDTEDQLLVRREINSSGKSRAFINDTPVTLQVLRQVAAEMVDLHRQFDTLTLGSGNFQREVVDALAGTTSLFQSYKNLFQNWSQTTAQLASIEFQQLQANKEMDYHRYLLEELENAGFAENEIEESENELQVLSQAEGIKQTLEKTYLNLQEGETPIVGQVKSLIQQLQQLKTMPAGLEDLVNRLQSAYLEIKDIGEELQVINDKIQLNAQHLDRLTERINLGNRLLKKHQVAATAELLKIQKELASGMQEADQLNEKIETLRQLEKEQHKEVMATGSRLSEMRKKAMPGFEKKMHQMLAQVGMPNAMLQVQCSPLSVPAWHGVDEIQFLFDANKSGRMEPLEKVASGGELSRLMLSIKSQVASKLQFPTLIFDEIDTGISGEAARQVGLIMEKLAEHHQLLAITHQPQIAARAQAHYFVYKQEKNGAIKTAIKELEVEEQVEAIATMLAGKEITEDSRNIALQLMARD